MLKLQYLRLLLAVESRLSEIDYTSPASIQQASDSIRGLIENTLIPDAVRGDVKRALSNMGASHFAVRSSGLAEDSTEELESVSLLNDTTCVQLNIRKQSGTNTVMVADAFKERLEELKPTMPSGYDVRIVRDQSVFIEASVHAVEEHMLLGGLLAAVVVFLFLANFRATIIAAVPDAQESESTTQGPVSPSRSAQRSACWRKS